MPSSSNPVFPFRKVMVISIEVPTNKPLSTGTVDDLYSEPLQQFTSSLMSTWPSGSRTPAINNRTLDQTCSMSKARHLNATQTEFLLGPRQLDTMARQIRHVENTRPSTRRQTPGPQGNCGPRKQTKMSMMFVGPRSQKST